jgi:3-deoxy-manno-octulosonate cytidylyltransferase (CMP-KDO synthetase)|tara:strand:- start:8570 stop:9304 length:735 start_codon:yes stop_codon:yes gene_type:complete
MKIIAIIPARYASTRFPGKPLVNIQGKPMVQHVYDKAIESKVFDKVIVATDDARIEKVVKDFGGTVMITSSAHQSGTDRCGEVINSLTDSFDIVVNIQGDEPFIHIEQLEQLVMLFNNPNTDIATLKKQLYNIQDVHNPNVVKVVAALDKRALYFSRNPVPFVRGTEKEKWLVKHHYYKHLGLYGYRVNVLRKLVELPTSSLENCESLEQLRWLQNGFSIFIDETEHESIGIDTPEDLERLLNK